MTNPLNDVDADENHYGYDVLQYDDVNIYTADSFNELIDGNFEQNHKSISLFHVNIRSIAKNYDNLSASLASLHLKFDIIALKLKKNPIQKGRGPKGIFFI